MNNLTGRINKCIYIYIHQYTLPILQGLDTGYPSRIGLFIKLKPLTVQVSEGRNQAIRVSWEQL